MSIFNSHSIEYQGALWKQKLLKWKQNLNIRMHIHACFVTFPVYS